MGNKPARWISNIKKNHFDKSNNNNEQTPPDAEDSTNVSDGANRSNRDALKPPVPPKPARPLPNVPPKVRVRAMYNFTGVSTDDLSFKRGDVLEIEENVIATNEETWWLATHVKSNKKGYIPSNFVTLDDASPKSQDWWFDYDRPTADKVLLLPGNKKGSFLIRPAGDGTSYAVSVLDIDIETDEPCVKHYRIRNMENGGFYISSAKTFSDLFELIEYYKKPNTKGLSCPLTVPCPRIRPTLHFRELEVARKEVKLTVKLGAGCFGEVYKGKFRKVVDVAVKTLKPGTMSSQAFLEEAKIMHKLTHHRLVQLTAVHSTSEPFLIITELMANGSLLDYLRSEKGKKLKFKQLIEMDSQVAEGMAYLETKNYIHRDLRAANILVGELCDVKVADFGLARILEDSSVYSAKQNTKFPVKWTAPEAANYKKFTIKSDVWSFGVLMYEIITFGKTPYPGMPPSEVLIMVDRGERMSKPSNPMIDIPDSYYEMMLKCWKQDAQARPTFESLHDFFDDYFINTEPSYTGI